MAKLKKPPPPSHEEFVFHARAPSLSYSFGIQRHRRLQEWEPFAETQSLTFTVECVWPDRFKSRIGPATIFPEPAFVDHKNLPKDDVRWKQIGYVRATKREFEAVLWLPPPMCWRLGEALASGLVRSMLTNGRVETGGMNRVISVSFEGQDFDPVEYVG